MQDKTLLDTFVAEPETLTEAQLEQASREAFNPEESKDFAMIGGVKFPIRILNWKYERRIVKIVAFYLKTILDAASVQMLEDTLGALLIESQNDLTEVACIILSNQPELIFDALPDLTTEAGQKTLKAMLSNWLDDNARFDEITNLVQLQLTKNGLAASLGKLWTPGSLGVKVLKILNTLESQTGQALMHKLTESAKGTGSTR